MSLKPLILLLATLGSQGYAQHAQVAWAADMNTASAAFATGKYALAETKYREALTKAEQAESSASVLVPILKSLAAALRTNGNPLGAHQVIQRTLALVRETYGETSLETAAVLSDLAVVQRAQDQLRDAITSLEEAIRIRSKSPLSEEVARDSTLAANLWREIGDTKQAIRYYQTALDLWGALPNSGLQILTTIDPMAALLRDEGDYPHAEELLTWALHLREATFGPKGSELISTIDSLAYVQFGQQKYLEAEVLYKRLLALWEQVGGPEHPMLALTLDKMAEFYIEQKFYDLAEPLAQRALAIRAKMTMESLHRSGRVLVGREKFTDATEWYARTVRIAAETRMPDEELPGVLRTYALLLRQMHRGKEADVISKRIKEAIDRKTEKEGRRPLPPSVPLPKS